MDSILISIKKFLGISEDYTVFDPDIIMHANSAFATLQQLGYSGYSISNSLETWTQYFAKSKVNADLHASVKQYVYLRVRLLFDPPANSFTQQAIKDTIDELTWRLNVQLETEALDGSSEGGGGEDYDKRVTNEMIDELW
jgi:hypothetical protein